MPILPLVFTPSSFLPSPTALSLLPFFSSKMSSSSSSSSKAQMIVEYAKSGRSSCKKCSKTIAASTLRLGLVTRDGRGFDMTKWHHLQCLPLNSNSVTSTDSIKGFSSLKSSDQEELKKLMKDSSESSEKVIDGEKDSCNETKKELKVCSTDDHEGTHIGERKAKKMKVRSRDDHEGTDMGDREAEKMKRSVSAEGVELEMAISASDMKDKYKDAILLPQWKAFQTVIFLERVDGLHDSRKIAAFDFDGCLAKTSVKKLGADAWSLMYPSIPEKLQGLYNNGYKLVIFTNESNIERWKNKRQVAVDSKIGRLESFIKLVKVPIQVFIACGLSSGQPEDTYRKPKTGMWHIMERHFNSGLKIDMDNSFYVGDAAGRPDDHSDADIKFAEAIGLKFYVPEQYFNS